jgi:hypothetical protein
VSDLPTPNPEIADLCPCLASETVMEALILAQQILFRLAFDRDDPDILRAIALRYLSDTLTPSGVRRVLAAAQLDTRRVP